jgi:hypothetical protein
METKKNNIWITILKAALILCFWPIFLIFLVSKSEKIDASSKKVFTIILVVLALIWFIIIGVICSSNHSEKADTQLVVEKTATTTTTSETTNPATTTIVITSVTEAITTNESTNPETEKVTTVPEEPAKNSLYTHTLRYNSFQEFKYYYIKISEDELYNLTAADLREYEDSMPDDATTLSLVIDQKIIFIHPSFNIYYADYGTYFDESDYSIHKSNCCIDYSGDKLIVEIADENYQEYSVGEYDTFSSEMFRYMDTLKLYTDY